MSAPELRPCLWECGGEITPFAAASGSYSASCRCGYRGPFRGSKSAAARAHNEAWERMQGLPTQLAGYHNRPNGTLCDYLAEGACNKCGWVASMDAPPEPEPELYEALETIIDISHGDPEDIIAVARAALAKARGEAPDD